MKLLQELTSLTEARNEMGEVVYSTFAGWKAAVKKNYPEAWFDGDKDISNAFVGTKPYKRKETRSVGEWDGAEGIVFAKKGATVTEGKEFGAYYYEQLAAKMPTGLDVNDKSFMKTAFSIAEKDLGKDRARGVVYYDEDFASDLASAYVWYQKNKDSVNLEEK